MAFGEPGDDDGTTCFNDEHHLLEEQLAAANKTIALLEPRIAEYNDRLHEAWEKIKYLENGADVLNKMHDEDKARIVTLEAVLLPIQEYCSEIADGHRDDETFCIQYGILRRAANALSGTSLCPMCRTEPCICDME